MKVKRGYAERDVKDLGPAAGVRGGHLMAAQRLGFKVSGGRVETPPKPELKPAEVVS